MWCLEHLDKLGCLFKQQEKGQVTIDRDWLLSNALDEFDFDCLLL